MIWVKFRLISGQIDLGGINHYMSQLQLDYKTRKGSLLFSMAIKYGSVIQERLHIKVTLVPKEY